MQTSSGISSPPGRASQENVPTPVNTVHEALKRDGVEAIFLTVASQKLFGVVPYEDFAIENPYKKVSKDEILTDIESKGVLSDFYNLKEKIEDYTGMDLLIVYDDEERSKKNFFVCMTEEAMNDIWSKISQSQQSLDNSSDLKKSADSPLGTRAIGTEQAIKEESIIPSRDLLKVSISRKRREFGGPHRFTDSDAHDGLVECRQFKNPNFDLIRMQKDVAVQAIAETTTTRTQTTWYRNVNSCAQTEPLVTDHDVLLTGDPFADPTLMGSLLRSSSSVIVATSPNKASATTQSTGTSTQTEQESSLRRQSKNVTAPPPQNVETNQGLLNESIIRYLELAIQQNETMDTFVDDFGTLMEEDVVVGNKSDNFMKEFQSFTDLDFSKDRTISALDWKPQGKGVVAVACAEKLDMDTRLSGSAKLSSSVILVWDFVDPIHPQVILEAPSDVLCFRYHPKRSNIIVAGCVNGQVVFWDTNFADKRKGLMQRKQKGPIVSSSSGGTPAVGGKEKEKDKDLSAPSVAIPSEEDKKHGSPSSQGPVSSTTATIYPFLVSSSIENGHKKPITDLHWLDSVKVSPDGDIAQLSSSSGEIGTQFVTIASDGQLLVWDIKDFQAKTNNVTSAEEAISLLKELDLLWAPTYRLSLLNHSSSLPYASTHMVLSSILSGAPNIKLFFGTEYGQLLLGDWNGCLKEKRYGLLESKKAQHYGPIVTLQQSPFFADILLSVGDWSLNIWKETVPVPLLSSPCASSYVTVARWSPKRPGVFFVGKADGSVEIWDLLDKSHVASIVQNVCSPSSITSLEFLSETIYNSTTDNHELVQLLAVGDDQGRLHILEVPRNLTHKVHKEKSLIQNFFAREEKRIEYVSRSPSTTL